MLKHVALLHLVRALVLSYSTIWPVLEMKPDSLTALTMVLVSITVFTLKTPVLFAEGTVSLCLKLSLDCGNDLCCMCSCL